MPLLADTPLTKSLELAFGYRYAEHSNAGGIEAYKGEVIWQINEPFTVRSSMQHAVRAPDFVSLFRPQVSFFGGLSFIGEPCESDFDDPDGEILGVAQDPDVAALCIAQGIPASELPTYVDVDNFVDGIRGGNPVLHEEAADTFTLGVVFQSPWGGVLAGLQASVDYFEIDIVDVIGYAGFPVFNCYNRGFNPTMDPEKFYCQQVGPGVPIQELQGTTSFAAVTAESVAFSLVPEWKYAVDVTYAVRGFDSTLRWRYIDSVVDDQIEEFVLPSRQYVDLSFGYTFETGVFKGLDIRAGVTNLTDEQPVVYPSSVEANTESSVYDVLGRRYFARATYAF